MPRSEPLTRAEIEWRRHQWRQAKRRERLSDSLHVDGRSTREHVGAQRVEGDTSWMDRAACIGEDTEMFFPGTGPANFLTKIALSICEGCDVKAECLDYAVKNDERGVWGGVTESTRNRVRSTGDLMMGETRSAL